MPNGNQQQSDREQQYQRRHPPRSVHARVYGELTGQPHQVPSARHSSKIAAPETEQYVAFSLAAVGSG